MNTEYVRGTSADRAEIVDFANYVFSQAHRPHDFKTLLPKAYADDRDTAACHYLARQDGRIRAMVAALPMKQTVAGHELSYGLVGTVSVHPYARGEGHMKRLMHDMIEDQRAQGADLLALGGQRQRYNHFGFEQAGLTLRYTFTAASMRHGARDVDASDIGFAEITCEEDPLLEQAFALYQRQVVTGARPRENLLHIMHSWKGSFYAVLCQGAFLGTLYTAGEDASLAELLLTDEEKLPAVLKAWMTQHDLSAAWLTVFPQETRRLRLIEPLFDSRAISPCEMICVLCWPRVLAACLNLKAMYQTLEEGELCLRVDGQTVLLRVHEGRAEASLTECAPQLELEHLQAQRVFFSMSALFDAPEGLPQSWTALPICLSSADTF